MIDGIIIFLILTATGGVIAFIGDKLGSKVGKRRISLWGLRPKHTSIVVTVITGMLISLLTIGVMSVISDNVRVALFGMDELRQKMATLTMQVEDQTKELERGKIMLAQKNREYEEMSERVRDTARALTHAEEQQAYMQAQLALVESAYRKAQADVHASAEEIRTLETTKTELTEAIGRLNDEADRLRTDITNIREGQVMFRVGEVVSSAVVKEGLTHDETVQVLASILNDTNTTLLKRLGIESQQEVVRILPETFEQAVKQVEGREVPGLVRVVSVGNIIVGEPAWVEFLIFDNRLTYRKGDIVFDKYMDDYDEYRAVEMKVLAFLREVNTKARQQGVLPDPITGNVGQLDGQELFTTIREIERVGGNAHVTAIATEDIYTEGPVKIKIIVSRD